MRSVQRFVAVLGCGILLAAVGASGAEAQTAKSPPAFVVLEFNIKDPEGFKEYAQRAPATLAPHGGKFLVRPGKVVTLAGNAPTGPFAVLAFDSSEQAQKWASSPEYSALIPLRDKSADVRIFIVEAASP